MARIGILLLIPDACKGTRVSGEILERNKGTKG